MTACAFLLDVVVGELQLTQPVPTVPHNRSPLCPIVGVQISNGPLLYIPFLTSENIKNHLYYIQRGHQFLPLEVEESYLNGGKFVFQRGKSCLYTVSNITDAESDKVTKGTASHENETLLTERRNIKVVILNGVSAPPAVFGRSETCLTTPDLAKLQQVLRGKLQLFNDKGKLVAYVTVSISCRNLGEDVALHTQGHNHVGTGGFEREEIPGVIPTLRLTKGKTVMPAAVLQQEYRKFEKDVVASVGKTGSYKVHNLLQPTEKSTVSCGVAKKDGTLQSQNCRLEQEYSYNQDLNDLPSNRHPVHHCTSEIIAMKIAEFESTCERRDADQDNWNTSVIYHGTDAESQQPPPILYMGHSVQGERLWNEKLQDMGEYVMQVTDSEHHEWKEPENKHQREHKERRRKHDSKEKHTKLIKSGDTTIRKTKKPDRPFNVKQSKYPKSMCHPTGWLRSAPVATLQHYKQAVHPKLNRTSLLRRAKLDPQLAQQLHTEIKYQVKQRLKCMDKGFEATLVKIQGKKLAKSHTNGKLTVGCQTVEGMRKDIQSINESSQKHSILETVHTSTDDHHHKETEGNLAQTSEKLVNAELGNSHEENNSSSNNGKQGVNELKRNLTFDIDVTELESNKADLIENYEEDFELSTDSQLSNLCNMSNGQNLSRSAPQTEMVVRSQKRSPPVSVSVSLSEPKQERKERKPTNKIRDNKLKVSDAKSGILIHSETFVKEPSLDTALTYTVHKEILEQRENTAKDKPGMLDQYSAMQPMHTNPETVNSNRSNTKSTDDVHSSQTCEISEASDLSAEVFEEILKGKHADLLMRNGSQMIDSKRVYSQSSEDSISEEQISGTGNMSVKYLENSRRYKGTARVSELSHDREILTSCKDMKDSSMVDDSLIKIVKSERILTEQDKVNDTSDIDYSEITTSPSASEKYDGAETASGKFLSSQKFCDKDGSSPRGLDDLGDSISDISARIAALLMPRRVSITQRNTDSISSYVPSNVSDTLSSLSDMTGD